MLYTRLGVQVFRQKIGAFVFIAIAYAIRHGLIF